MKTKNKMKKAFTLAEVMITLTVIGIMTAIILPVAFHSRPDEHVMKFKKAHNTFYQTIQTLINSDEYFLDGDLGVRANGVAIDGTHDGDKKYLCNAFADILSTKAQNCSEYMGLSRKDYHILISVDSYWREPSFEKVDETCKQAAKYAKEEIKTTDGIVYYQAAAGYTYQTKGYNYDIRDENNELQEVEKTDSPFYLKDSSGFYYTGKIFCIDIDGIPADGSDNCDDIKDICPFSYGVRCDGKIIVGARAKKWLEKSIQSN